MSLNVATTGLPPVSSCVLILLAACSLGAPSLLASDLAAPGPIIISEINYNPPSEVGSDDDLEFVELYNRGTVAVDISGWELHDRSDGGVFRAPAGTTVESGAYLVLAREPDALRLLYGQELSVVGNVPFALSNGGDVLRLYDAAGELVDRVEFDDRLPWPEPADADGATLERISLADDITDFTNFAPSAPSDPPGTPGRPNSRAGVIAARHDIVIHELQYHPVKDADEERLRHCPQEEFLELYNRGTETIDLSGWSFAEGPEYTFPAGVTLAPDSYLVLYFDETGFRKKYGDVAALYGPYARELDNGGEDLLLVDAAGLPVDLVDYNDAAPWPISADGVRGSLELIDPFTDNERGQAWRGSSGNVGTPGAMNSASEQAQTTGNAGPQITGVDGETTADPERRQVLSSDTFDVEARVVDRDGVAAVTLEYQVVLPGAYIRRTDPVYETNWTAVPMSYDAAAGKYRGQIPAQAHRTLVRYRLVARDAASIPVESYAPFREDPEPNLGYFVFDGVPDYVASEQSAFGQPGFAHTDLEKLPVYFIIGDQEEIRAVQFDELPVGEYDRYLFDVTFAYDGRVYDHVRVRLRGSQTSRYGSPKRSWKIKFNKGNRFRGVYNDGTRYDNARSKLNIVRASDYGLIESLALKIYRDCDTLASRTTFVQLRVVDETEEAGQFTGDFFGLYLDLQAVDKVLMQDAGRPTDETASIYKFRGFPDKKHSDCDPEDRRDLEAFLAPLGSGEATREYLESEMDVAEYLSFHVATDLTENHDMDGKNYYRYFNSDSGWWEIVPWDVDGAFRKTTGEEPLFLSLRLFPIDYARRFRFLWQVVYDPDRLQGIVDGWRELIREIAQANQDRWGGAPLESTVTRLVDFTRTQRTLLIRQFLDTQVPFRPFHLRPLPGAVTTLPVVLQSSPFGDSDREDTHAASEWLMIPRGGDWASPLWRLESTNDLTAITVPADVLEVGMEYEFRVRHTDSSGRVGYLSDPSAFRVEASPAAELATPAGLAVESAGFRSVVLSWGAVPDAIGYRIFRDGELLALSVEEVRFVDGVVTPGTVATYEVIAMDTNGRSSRPATVEVQVPRGELGGWGAPEGGLAYLFDAGMGQDAFSDPQLERRGRYLDGRWVPALVNRWDGSAPGSGNSGGLEAISVEGAAEDGTPTTVLAFEDPAEPTPGVSLDNSRLYFVHEMGAGNAIDEGVTLVGRLRLTPGGPDFPLASGQAPSSSRGLLGIGSREGTRRHFSLWLLEDGLHLSTGEIVAVPVTEFVSIWLTLVAEGDGHRVRLYVNGADAPAVDAVVGIRGSGSENVEGSYLEMGFSNGAAPGAMEVDYFGYQHGVQAPPGGSMAIGFVRGDATADGALAIDDAVTILEGIFTRGPVLPCRDAADVNDDGRVNILDPIVLASVLFGGREGLPDPFPSCGPDPTDDGLTCSDAVCP